MFENIKSKIINANLNTRLAFAGGISSLSLLGGNLVSADTTVTENVVNSINKGLSAGVTSFETSFGNLLMSNAGGIIQIISFVIVSFGVLNYAKRLLSQAF